MGGEVAREAGDRRADLRALALETRRERIVEVEQDLAPLHAHLGMIERQPHLRRVAGGIGGDTIRVAADLLLGRRQSGGAFEMTSSPGAGTTFRILLPLAAVG